MKELTIGIDLGTTSSCAALYDGVTTRILEDRQGYKLTPSCVAVTPQHRVVVGHPARRQALTNPTGTVTAFKRLLGRSFDSDVIRDLRGRVPYEITGGNRGQAVASLHGRSVSPVEMAAYILRELREAASQSLGAPVTRAVITVPASYNEIQRQATHLAAKMAGLEPLRLMNEPTAAALAYSVANPGRRTIAIFDLGGGTFDVTIMRIDRDVFEVLATCGDTLLGGENFDDAIVGHWLEAIRQKEGVDLTGDSAALSRLKEAAETAKISLSTQPMAMVDLPFLTRKGDKAVNFAATLTRTALANLAQPLVDRLVGTCREALHLARLKTTDIQDVVLIGGMTRAPVVQKAASDFFGRQPVKGIHPEEAVASGAARYAHLLSTGESKQVLLDVLPRQLSLVSAGVCRPLIEQGARLPARRSETFVTTQDNQQSVKLRVVQGESKRPEENALLGVFEINGLPAKPQGEVQLRVEFYVDTNGLLEVSAVDTASGTVHSVSVSEAVRSADSELLKLMTSAA